MTMLIVIYHFINYAHEFCYMGPMGGLFDTFFSRVGFCSTCGGFSLLFSTYVGPFSLCGDRAGGRFCPYGEFCGCLPLPLCNFLTTPMITRKLSWMVHFVCCYFLLFLDISFESPSCLNLYGLHNTNKPQIIIHRTTRSWYNNQLLLRIVVKPIRY